MAAGRSPGRYRPAGAWNRARRAERLAGTSGGGEEEAGGRGAGAAESGAELRAAPGDRRAGVGAVWKWLFLKIIIIFLYFIFNALSDRDLYSLPEGGGGGARPSRELGRSPGERRQAEGAGLAKAGAGLAGESWAAWGRQQDARGKVFV